MVKDSSMERRANRNALEMELTEAHGMHLCEWEGRPLSEGWQWYTASMWCHFCELDN